MDEIPRQGLRQLPRHNPRKLSGFEVGAVYANNLFQSPLTGQYGFGADLECGAAYHVMVKCRFWAVKFIVRCRRKSEQCHTRRRLPRSRQSHSSATGKDQTPKAWAALGILEKHGWLVALKAGAVVRGAARKEAWRVLRAG
jgi:hypothetical protein